MKKVLPWPGWLMNTNAATVGFLDAANDGQPEANPSSFAAMRSGLANLG
jgi:hypothetical protein